MERSLSLYLPLSLSLSLSFLLSLPLSSPLSLSLPLFVSIYFSYMHINTVSLYTHPLSVSLSLSLSHSIVIFFSICIDQSILCIFYSWSVKIWVPVSQWRCVWERERHWGERERERERERESTCTLYNIIRSSGSICKPSFRGVPHKKCYLQFIKDHFYRM